MSLSPNRTTVACEILDLTERRQYQKNEILRKTKTEKCNQEFIITEDGMFYPVSICIMWTRRRVVEIKRMIQKSARSETFRICVP